MDTILLSIVAVGLLLDTISNIILARITPIWGKLQRQELAELREQNEELREFIKAYVEEREMRESG